MDVDFDGPGEASSPNPLPIPEVLRDTQKAYKLYSKCRNTTSQIYAKGQEYVGYAHEVSAAIMPEEHKDSNWWKKMSLQQRTNFLIGIVILVTFISIILYLVYRPKYARNVEWRTATLVAGLLLWTGFYHVYLAFQETAYLKNDVKWVDYAISLSLMIIVACSVLELNHDANQDTAFLYMGAVGVGLFILWCGYWSEVTESRKVKWGVMVLALAFVMGACCAAYEMYQKNRLPDHILHGDYNKRFLPAFVITAYLCILLMLQFFNTVFDIKPAHYEGLHLWFGLSMKTVFVSSYVYQYSYN